MTAPARFKQSDIERAIRAARNAGVRVAGFRIEPDGSIMVQLADSAANDRGTNPLDWLFDASKK